ncbi:MAG: peptide chain release factor N(5)-glutamine methyltransferase [candidate division WOR-3 bacterium]
MRNLLPRAEVEYLAMGLLGMSRSEIYLSQREINSQTISRFYQLIKRARTGEPVQYLVNCARFLELELFVDPRVFIPRPETEELVLRAQTHIKSPALIIDYGTGSGCIALALARRFPGARVLAIDISTAALAVARINIRRYRLDDQIRLIRAGSLNSPYLKRLKSRVDLFISNPPYIPQERLPRIEKRVRNYEPLSALNGGAGGTEVIEMIIHQAPALLKPGGLLAMEIDATHGDFIINRLAGARIEPDIYGKTRYAFWWKEQKQ